jgi:hypothetical protein
MIFPKKRCGTPDSWAVEVQYFGGGAAIITGGWDVDFGVWGISRLAET